jgi:hypothetical protein
MTLSNLTTNYLCLNPTKKTCNNNLKKSQVLKEGYNFIFIIDKNYSEFISLIQK